MGTNVDWIIHYILDAPAPILTFAMPIRTEWENTDIRISKWC